MAKRSAVYDSNRDNLNEGENSDEQGSKKRTIQNARREVATATDDAGLFKGVFSDFSGFQNSATGGATPSAAPFSSVTKLTIPAATPKFTDSSNTAAKETINCIVPLSADGKSANYKAHLTQLNRFVFAWIKTQVDENPYCTLNAVFNDYIEYMKQLEEKEAEWKESETTKSEVPLSGSPFSQVDLNPFRTLKPIFENYLKELAEKEAELKKSETTKSAGKETSDKTAKDDKN